MKNIDFPITDVSNVKHITCGTAGSLVVVVLLYKLVANDNGIRKKEEDSTDSKDTYDGTETCKISPP